MQCQMSDVVIVIVQRRAPDADCLFQSGGSDMAHRESEAANSVGGIPYTTLPPPFRTGKHIMNETKESTSNRAHERAQPRHIIAVEVAASASASNCRSDAAPQWAAPAPSPEPALPPRA